MAYHDPAGGQLAGWRLGDPGAVREKYLCYPWTFLVIVAPPHSFRSPSHALVRQAGMGFWPVGNDVAWEALWAAHRHTADYELVSHLSGGIYSIRTLPRCRTTRVWRRVTGARRSRAPGQDEQLQDDGQPIGCARVPPPTQ